MYDTIKIVIDAGRYALADMLQRIDFAYVQGYITNDQHTELVQLARDKADPVSSYAPLQEQINELFDLHKALKEAVEANALGMGAIKDAVEKLGGVVTPAEPEEPAADEWPEFVQPTGAHNAYNTGDKITHDGDHYICLMDGCVWSPLEYPAGWEKQ